ncbi:MAG TPA: DJ-1/PfpI family protein, partial [Thermoanaerobaculia bacterium]
HVESRGTTMDEMMPFELYTVAESRKPIRVSGGMQIVPDYTFDDAPAPKIVVVPAQHGGSEKMLAWLRKRSTESDVVMSVCNGAFELAKAGLLKGKPATAHHSSYARFQQDFPDIHVEKDRRYVQSDPVIFTAGGLSSGIDLALHIVDLYFGRQVAAKTARDLEYEGQGWTGDGTAAVRYSVPAAAAHPSDEQSHGLLGNWQGTVATKQGDYRLALHLWREKDGRFTGTIDSLDSDAIDLPLGALSGREPDLHFEVASAASVFDGKLDGDGSAIRGTLKLNGEPLPLTLQRVAK